ncbi:MAG: hypothetical protein AAFX94_21040, partial [Myxococcota bacterium]
MKLIEAMRASLASAENEAVVLWEGFSGRAVRGRRAQVLYHATDPSDAVYLLLSGEARCYVVAENCRRTNQQGGLCTVLAVHVAAGFAAQE